MSYFYRSPWAVEKFWKRSSDTARPSETYEERSNTLIRYLMNVSYWAEHHWGSLRYVLLLIVYILQQFTSNLHFRHTKGESLIHEFTKFFALERTHFSLDKLEGQLGRTFTNAKGKYRTNLKKAQDATAATALRRGHWGDACTANRSPNDSDTTENEDKWRKVTKL